ncbi:MAG: hypothetical protein HY719_11420 [Planctomycetes bacterium]|nr:hypothetical protein [Planctomycetota bacterium]
MTSARPRSLRSIFRWLAPTAFVAAALLVAVWQVMPAREALAREEKAGDLFEEATRNFEKKSWKKAREGYAKVLSLEPARADRRAIELRVAECHRNLGEWNDAIAAGRALRAATGGALWEARAQHFLASCFFTKPHWDAVKGDQRSYAGDIPGGDRVSSYTEDARAACAAAEEARGVYELYRTGKRAAESEAPAEPLGDLIVDLGFLWASQLEQAWYGPREDFEAVAQAPWAVALTARGYEFKPPAQNAESNVRFLYEDVEKIARETAPKKAAKALYREAAYEVRLLGLNGDRSGGPGGEPFKWAMPPERNPLKILARLGERYPDTVEAEVARFQFGRLLLNTGDFLGAVRAFTLFVQKHPKSLYVSDANAALQEIRRERLSFQAPRSFLPGEVATVDLDTRNLKEVEFTAWPVSLRTLFLGDAARRNVKSLFADLGRYLQRREDFSGATLGESLAWKVDTGDTADHRPLRKKVETPLAKVGAYVVEAKAGGLTFYNLVNLSGIAFAERYDGRRAFVYVAEAKAGRPVGGVNVTCKEVQDWWLLNIRREAVEYVEGKSDDAGVFEGVFVNRRDNFSATHAVLAWRGEEYAVTNPQWRDTSLVRDDQTENYKVYAFTDRPVYRPEQTVNWKAVARAVTLGKIAPLENHPCDVRIVDARGNELYKKQHRTGEFGTISGSLTLAKEPPLGAWTLQIQNAAPRRNRWFDGGYHTFQVEEYKKPEYEVSVVPADPFLKLGRKGSAKIVARYYFGAPVADADVKYRVTRRAYWHSPSFPLEYSWLYDYDPNAWWQRRHGYRDMSHDGYGEELVAESTGKTDAHGELKVEFDTAAAKEKFPNVDHNYLFNVTVTDASRRNIDGYGELKVTRRAFFIALRPDRAFYTAGDRAQIEVRAENPSGAPVKNEGHVVVYRLRERELTEKDALPPGKKVGDPVEEREEILREKAATDERGRLMYNWTPDEGGKFLVNFETKDGDGDPVEGGVVLVVAGEHWEGDRYRFGDVEIATDLPIYREGRTAKVMVTTNFKGAHALVTIEAGREMLARRIVPLPDKVAWFELPIAPAHVPNFHINAVLIRGGNVHLAQAEVFVPPLRHFVNVAVKALKPDYAPGQKATVDVRTTDDQGQPVSAEVAVGVVDASLFAIARDTTERIEKYFYGWRRWLATRATGSPEYRPNGHLRDGAKYERYATHGAPPGFDYFYGGWTEYDRANLELGDFLTRAQKGDGAPGGRLRGALRALGGGAAGGEGESKSMERLEEAPASGAMPASPAPAPPGEPGRDMMLRDGAGATPESTVTAGVKLGLEGDKPLVEARTRENFADTAFWGPSVVTDQSGAARVEFTMPDSLTTWRLDARAVDEGSRVGSARGSVVTRKNLLVRPQAPRFFVESDEVVLSANVHNYLASEKQVVARLETGTELVAAGETEKKIAVAAGGHARVDWTVRVAAPGEVVVKMSALTDEESDAAQMRFPVFPYGADRHDLTTAVIGANDARAVLKLTLPAKRREGSERMRLTLNPSLAATLLDAVPYLIKYPYGCVEQTMSRFLPAVVVKRSLVEMGVDLGDLAKRRREIVKKHPRLSYAGAENPVFSNAELDRVIQAGLLRLAAFQHGDGGWGWWMLDKSDPYMSAYVLAGLVTAREGDVRIDGGMIDRGFAYLSAVYHGKEITNIHLLTYLASVMSARPGVVKREHLKKLFDRRDDMNFYSRALLALTCQQIGDQESAKTIIDNMEDRALVDEEAGTANWPAGDEGRWWWYWYNNHVETNAAMLRAILRANPKHRMVPGLVKWLVNHRKGTAWASTKETAFAILGLAEYIRREKELDAAFTVKVSINGRAVHEAAVDRATIFAFNNEIDLGPNDLTGGEMLLEIEKIGTGKLYVSAMLDYFSKEEKLRRSGLDLKVDREYFRLIPQKKVKNEGGKEVTVVETRRVALAEGDALTSGDEIDVVLKIEAKNDYEYVCFEDMKAAGCEPVALQSGSSWAGGLSSTMELRDEKVAFFLSFLPQGKHETSYKMRAEIPGTFHALPARGFAMYAPDVKGNSDGFVMKVVDR